MAANRDLTVWKASPPAARPTGYDALVRLCLRQVQVNRANHARSVREYQKRIHRVATRSARRLLDIRA